LHGFAGELALIENKIAFQKTYRFVFDVFLLIRVFCSFSLLAQRKRTKRKGLFGPHKCHFCLWQNLIYKPKIPTGIQDFCGL
jgi:hypothetical protein